LVKKESERDSLVRRKRRGRRKRRRRRRVSE
jgi:hypothetical protein